MAATFKYPYNMFSLKGDTLPQDPKQSKDCEPRTSMAYGHGTARSRDSAVRLVES